MNEKPSSWILPYRTIKEDKVISPKHRFRPGQLIYSKIRPYLRKAMIASFEGACSADMYPLSPKEHVSNRFLLYWLISEQFAGFTIDHQGRTVLPKINQEGLNRTPFPLAPLRAQEQLAQRIDRAFAWIDRVAFEAADARRLIDQLDQAILAKAFQGALVPQDPRDEPANVLLERIRAARATTPTARSRNGKGKPSITAARSQRKRRKH
jgi:type I restriction enzyme, S subunit